MKQLFLAGFLASSLAAGELRQHPDADHLVSYDEAVAYCQEEAGWRLPTMAELFALIHDHPDTIKHASRNYWALESFTANPQMAWQMLNPDMDAKPMEKTAKMSVLCVKATPVKKDLRKRYERQKEMIYDSGKNLYWQVIERKERRNRYNHTDAANRCASLDTGGMSWRLPTLPELFSLVEYDRFDPALDKEIFQYTYPKYYWSADAPGDFSNEAYVVGMKVGSIALSSKVNESFVRCVSEGKE